MKKLTKRLLSVMIAVAVTLCGTMSIMAAETENATYEEFNTNYVSDDEGILTSPQSGTKNLAVTGGFYLPSGGSIGLIVSSHTKIKLFIWQGEAGETVSDGTINSTNGNGDVFVIPRNDGRPYSAGWYTYRIQAVDNGTFTVQFVNLSK